MARTKQTARKHTGGQPNMGRKAGKVKTRLRRAVLASDPRWGSAAKTFVEPKAGRLRFHTHAPNRLDYRCT